MLPASTAHALLVLLVLLVLQEQLSTAMKYNEHIKLHIARIADDLHPLRVLVSRSMHMPQVSPAGMPYGSSTAQPPAAPYGQLPPAAAHPCSVSLMRQACYPLCSVSQSVSECGCTLGGRVVSGGPAS